MTNSYKESIKIKSLVDEIIAFNHAWKSATILFGSDSPSAQSARDLKSALQIRLLRSYPEQVFLELDSNISQEEEGEDLYSVRLVNPIGNRNNAEHIPVRVAHQLLIKSEIKTLIRRSNFLS
ncbi:MAG: hypothetical protein EWV53_06995 [Microcystis panniformis Mp_MB_F_20051200_S9]|uniref:Uncharacterized protein n=1 Tax=Microcystis panniformis Mp_MB_F_20051200_S9 TaxID=2486223 RepID=A0A552Q4J6_9CHRO|nr:MAG: hypothetical protein EWV43_23595 [Microcystis panniformis Mp_MB_F_20080800_S26D]TRV43272.1 MAG: hypothetical protein EWV42_23780 [Microcystis panniformis Mp_GB_SS_20050300_S99D]TRV49580.1 MAG: hypothetical protein EWV87_10065 [Microcystis panniformis Mp_GB_SS_20050300_S99]TRV64156.1 MAG: hypothetical protein EWV53_06995 [Microcystis panniformis Mp_MB_F_20051200_S9]TRV64946.1 MAG: hypothetical protein EWV69_00385 [Microcystis panniformis Mp_MB_F_20080800_S26]TRV68884.1 MAG: hypothetical